jgi:hypothetical protein
MSTSAVQVRIPIYEAIRQAALAQQAALESDDLETFQHLMIQREELLASIEGEGHGLGDDVMVSGVEKAITGVDLPTQKKAAAVLGDILRTDRELQRLLTARIEETRDDLVQLHSGRHAARAYLTGDRAGGAFIDRRS